MTGHYQKVIETQFLIYLSEIRDLIYFLCVYNKYIYIKSEILSK